MTQECMWTVMEAQGMPSTNNLAERYLRRASAGRSSGARRASAPTRRPELASSPASYPPSQRYSCSSGQSPTSSFKRGRHMSMDQLLRHAAQPRDHSRIMSQGECWLNTFTSKRSIARWRLIYPALFGIIVLSACVEESSVSEIEEFRSGGAVPTAYDAVAMSIELMPDGIVPEDFFVGQATLGNVAGDWYETFSSPEWDDSAAVWVVALSIPGKMNDELIEPPPFAGFAEAYADGYESPEAGGAYFIIEQDAGLLMAQGVLAPEDEPSKWNHIDRMREISYSSCSCPTMTTRTAGRYS